MTAALIRKAFLLLLGVILSLCTGACRTTGQGGRNSPAVVSERFFKCLKELDYEKAKELGTDKTDRILSLIETLSGMGGGINILRDNKKELIGCEIDGEQAVCTYKAFSGPDEKVVLMKVKGKWLVDLTGQEGKP